MKKVKQIQTKYFKKQGQKAIKNVNKDGQNIKKKTRQTATKKVKQKETKQRKKKQGQHL